MITLLSAAASPFVRKVRVLLLETQQDDVALQDVTTTPVATAPEVASANPVGKIPALIRDDGPALYDSRVICRFLDDRAKAGLYPDHQLWDTLTLEATADGILDAALLITYEARMRPEDKQWMDWADAQWSKIENACAALTARWMSHLNGPLDMGQIAVACSLAYVDFRHDARGWRKNNDALAQWYQTFSERPSMKVTQPPEGA